MSERISGLLRALTLEEKIPMMIHGQAGVPRLGLPPFQFWTGEEKQRIAGADDAGMVFGAVWCLEQSSRQQSHLPRTAKSSWPDMQTLQTPRQGCNYCSASLAQNVLRLLHYA